MKLLNEMFILVSQPDDDTFRVRINAEHAIYRAHFPEKPITPGVCIVQLLTELLALRMQRSMQLERISNIKYLLPILPNETNELDILLKATEQDGQVTAKGQIFYQDKIFTKYSIVCK